MEHLLEVKNVIKQFQIYDRGVVFRHYNYLTAVNNVSFTIDPGECFGIAGESGSGKTTIAKMILLLEDITSGDILFKGKSIKHLTPQDRSGYRRSVQTIFQDAASSLNPRMCIQSIISEPLEIQLKGKLSKQAISDRTEEMLRLVGLTPSCMLKYPHELSGGQKQRVAIARAIILEPSLVVLDEPVSALDVSIRAQILNLLVDIQERHNLAYLLIAHDLGMLQNVTDKIAVMYLGKIVEIGDTDEVFQNPTHPYTKALFSAVPQPDPFRVKTAPALIGEIGNPLYPPSGCHFHPRCSQAQKECEQGIPGYLKVTKNHLVSCHRL